MSTNAILGITIPIGYVLGASVAFGVFYLALMRQPPKTSAYGTVNYPAKGDSAFNAALASVFWPLMLPLFVAWLVASRFETSTDGLTRKQQATLKFERERAEIAKAAVAAQREWQQLLDQESAS